MKMQKITFLTSAALATISLLTVNSNNQVQAATNDSNVSSTNATNNETDLATAQKNVSDAKANLDNATKAYNDAKSVSDTATKNKQEAQQNLDSANKAKAEAQKNVTDATPENIQKAKDAVKTSQDSVDKNTESLRDANSAKDKSAESLNSAQKSQTEAQGKVDAQQKVVDSAQNNVNSAQKAFDETSTGKAQAKLDDANKKIDSLTKTINNAPADKQKISNEKEDLQNKLNKQNDIVKSATDKFNNAKANSDKINADYQSKLAALHAAENAVKELNNSSTENHINIDVQGLKDTLNKVHTLVDDMTLNPQNYSEEQGDQIYTKANKLFKEFMDKEWQNNTFKSNAKDKSTIIDFDSLTPEQNLELTKYTIGLVNDVRAQLGMPTLKINNSAMSMMADYAKQLKDYKGSEDDKDDFESDLQKSLSKQYGYDPKSINDGYNFDGLRNLNFETNKVMDPTAKSEDDADYNTVNNNPTDNKISLDKAKYDIFNGLKWNLFYTSYDMSPFYTDNGNASNELEFDPNVTITGMEFVTNGHTVSSIMVAIDSKEVEDTTKFDLNNNVETPATSQEAQQKLAEAQSSFAAVEAQKKNSDKVVQDAKGSLDSVKKAQSDLSDKLAQVNKEISEFDSNISKASSDLAQAKKDKEEAQRELDKTAQDATKQKDALEKAKEELSKEKSKLTGLQSKLEDAKKVTNAAQKDLIEKSNDVANAKKALDQANSNLDNAKKRLSNLENAPENLKSAEKAVEDANAKLNDTVKDENQAKDKLVEAQKALNEAQTTYNVSKQKVDNIQARIDAENTINNVPDNNSNSKDTKKNESSTSTTNKNTSIPKQTIVKNNKLRKVKLTHTAFIYKKSGKVTKKGLKISYIKRGKTVKTLKIVTIKGKKYYKIGKNKYIKVANAKLTTHVVHLTASVKGKKNHKIRAYSRNGKYNKHHVLSGRRYKFNEKLTINGKTYYKIAGKNDWIPASKLNLKK